MRLSASLLLAVLVLAPAVAAQSLMLTDAPTRVAFARADAAFAPGDTTYLTNIPPGTTSISTFSSGENYLFGTGSGAFGITEFGAAYTMPDDGAEYEVIGAALFVTRTPDGGGLGESFEVKVYEGTVAGGPTGEPIYAEDFPASAIPPVTSDGVLPTVTFFAEPVSLSGPAFFVTYDVAGITSTFAGGSTGLLDDPTPETVILRNGAWARVDEEFTTQVEGQSVPLQIQLFAEAAVREVDPDGTVSAIVSARAAGGGATVTVEGVVSRSEGAFTYLQDETGGLAIRQTSGAFFDAVQANTIRPGQIVRVTGTLSEFNGLLQISGGALASFEVRGGTAVPAPQEVTLATLAANGEAYEGELVLVPDVTFTGLAQTGVQFTAATTYPVSDPTDATGAVTVRVPNADDTLVDGTDFLGNPARVTGVVGQFSSTDPAGGYQILLLQVGEVQPAAVAAGEAPDGRFGLSGVVPNPAAETGVVTVSLAAAGPVSLAVVDVLGREVARVVDGSLAAGAHPVRLDVSGLPAGTYLVRLSADGAVMARPFTVAR